ncbi:MAG: hypothetical protein ACJ74Z_10760, partial [Bryobacteraceae bacterium]
PERYQAKGRLSAFPTWAVYIIAIGALPPSFHPQKLLWRTTTHSALRTSQIPESAADQLKGC